MRGLDMRQKLRSEGSTRQKQRPKSAAVLPTPLGGKGKNELSTSRVLHNSSMSLDYGSGCYVQKLSA